MADKPTPSGPSAAQLALMKKYLANAGWSEGDLEELFAPDMGIPRPSMTPAEADRLGNQYMPNVVSAISGEPGLISILAQAATEGVGLYDPQVSTIIDEYISKGQGLNPSVKDAEGYMKIFEGFVGDYNKYRDAFTELEQKYTPIEVKKGLPSRDARYSAPVGEGALDPSVVNAFFPSMTKNLADYKAKNPEKMYDLPMVNRPDAPMSTTGIKPSALIKTLETALQGEPDAGGSVMVNGTRVNAFDVRTLLESLTKSQKAPVRVQTANDPTSASAVYSVELAQKNFDEMNRRYGPTSRTPRREVVEKARAALTLAKEGSEVSNKTLKADADAKNLNIDSSNFAAMKAILDKNPAAWVKAAMGGPVTAVPQKMLTQRGGQGQENMNPTYAWQNMLAVMDAKKRLEASGRTPYYDALFNMARSGASNLKGK
jgi:hypothetical protein